jgi:hypothetical protein
MTTRLYIVIAVLMVVVGPVITGPTTTIRIAITTLRRLNQRLLSS